MRRLLASGLAWIVLLCGADQAAAGWNKPAQGSLNADTALEADSASVAAIDGTPWVAWEEYDASNRSQIRVRRLDGTTWTAIGGSLNVSTARDAYSPVITGVGGVPYVTWQETDGSHTQIRVKRLEAGSWTAVGDSLNFDVSREADSPSIANVGSVAYVAWSESDATHEQIRVKRFDGLAWQSVGASLNVSTSQNADGASITATSGGVPYVAWHESDGSAYQVRVARLDGTTWTPVGGGSLNISATEDSDNPRITIIADVPYVIWPEDTAAASQIHVKRLEGNAWAEVGGVLNTSGSQSAGHSSIAGAGGTPMAVWHEYLGDHYEIYARRFDGSDWIAVGPGSLNVSNAFTAGNPSIASVGGVPYVGWDEYDGATSRQIQVKRLEPDFLGTSATPSLNGAALGAQVDDFGLSLPVAFEYGTTGAFGTVTPLQMTSGAGVSTVTQDVSGLTPLTTYSFRAFGSDGVRQTSLGATQMFTTLAAGGTPPPVPAIRDLKLTPARFVAAARGASVVAAARSGTIVTYADSAAATTTFTVQRPAVGRRKGGSCVKSRKRPPKATRCTRYVKVGSFKHTDAAGANRFRFTGRTGGRKLKPGAYRLRAVARNAAGAGKPATRRFRVTKR